MKHSYHGFLSHLLACFLLLLGSAVAYPFHATAQLFILNSSPSGASGEVINLQGNFSATAQIHLSGSGGSWTLPPLAQSAGQATVRIPAGLNLDLYHVWVQEGSQSSPHVFINRARGMHFDSPDIVPGDTVRLFGRNLLLAGGIPQVSLVPQGGGASITATVLSTGSDAYQLVVRIPTSLVPTTPATLYEVRVTNGLGGNLGETKVEQQTLQLLTAGSNPYHLPVGWGHKFTFTGNKYDVTADSRLPIKAVGNGITNDRETIQDAINRAATAGGGIVYLPAGTYKLAANGLVMRNKVVIQGDGKGQTTIQYGFTASKTDHGVYVAPNITTCGLVNLTIQNVAADGAWESNLLGIRGQEFVLNNVEWKMSLGQRLNLEAFNKICITNCEFTQGNTWKTKRYVGTIRLDASKNVVFAGNKLTFATGGLAFNFMSDGLGAGGCENIVLENNELYRDGSARWPVVPKDCDNSDPDTCRELVNHMASFEFSRNVANLNNLYKVTTTNPQNINDGEAIIAEQGAGYHPDESVGTVTRTSNNSLVDSTKFWPASFEQQGVAIGVSIVHGKGMGQWRKISSRSGNTLTIEGEWDVNPDRTSRYAIHVWGSENWLVRGNHLENNQRGITMYFNASRDIAIVDNDLVNSGSIDFTPVSSEQLDMAVPANSVTKGLYPVWNTQVVNNRVSDLNGQMGVFIGVHTIQHVNPRTFGTTVLGFEVRGNTLRAHPSHPIAEVDADFRNGYYSGVYYQPQYIRNTAGIYVAVSYIDEHIPVTLGTIFQNNEAINCEKALYLNTSSYNTVVCDMDLTASTDSLVEDSVLPGTSHRSVRTNTTCLPLPVVSLRVPENPASTAAGLTYAYYEHAAELNQLPDFATLTPVSTGMAALPDLTPRQRDTNFSLQYTGFVTVPTDGLYTFYTNSDDGSRLSIGQTVVVENDWSHWFEEKSGTIGLQAGTHAITITYFQNGGDKGLTVSYQGPDIAQQVIPATAWVHAHAQPTLVYRVNAGAGAVTNSIGTFAADQYYSAGSSHVTSSAIAGTTDDAIYQSERNGNFGYSFPVPNGAYTLILHFAEVYWTLPNQRVFNVTAEGTPRLTNYDIVGKVGPLTATTEVLPVTVTDGSLDLSFTASVDQAKISAIEVVSGNLAARAPSTALASSAGLHVYPNPTQGAFTVDYTARKSEQGVLTLTDHLGRTLKRQTVELQLGRNQVAVQADGLAPGLYQVTLVADSGKPESQHIMIGH